MSSEVRTQELARAEAERDAERIAELEAEAERQITEEAYDYYAEQNRESFVAGASWQAERDAERITELEAEVERLNDALDAADVRYQMLGDWSERMKAEAEHLRTYAEKQDELIHRLRVRAEWDDVWRALNTPGTLGRSKAEQTLEKVNRMNKLIESLTYEAENIPKG